MDGCVCLLNWHIRLCLSALSTCLYFAHTVWLMLLTGDSCLICMLFLSSKVSDAYKWIGLLSVRLAYHVGLLILRLTVPVITRSSAIAERPRCRWVSFGRNISGRRYSAQKVVGARKLRALIFYTINTFLYEKQSLSVFSPLGRLRGNVRCSS